MVIGPNDLINTGTPSGVGAGRMPPVFLNEGDVMELSVEGLGSQPAGSARRSRRRCAAWPSFGLTTVHNPMREIARRAAAMLVLLVEAAGDGEHEVFPTHLVLRRTHGGTANAKLKR